MNRKSLLALVLLCLFTKIVDCQETGQTIMSVKSDTPASYWKGKKIVWFGTSIPAGGYPQLVGNILGATVINEAVGSSGARRGKRQTSKEDPYGWEDLAWQNATRSLSQNLVEKKELIDNWEKWRAKFRNGKEAPAKLSEAQIKYIQDCSWEIRLNRNLGEGKRADLYVFDHGHNDNLAYLPDYKDMDVMPENNRDRNYFLGAMNFLIDKILEDNPRARICFVGHYENQKKPIIALGQQKLAAYWGYPLLELWSKLGWSQQKVNTSGYWKDNKTWVSSSDKVTQKTMTQIWMQDDLHPASEQAKALIAENIAVWLETVR